jgi:hypothetical protein
MFSVFILALGASWGSIWGYFWQSKFFGYGPFPHKSVNSMLVLRSRRTPLGWNNAHHSMLLVQPKSKGLSHSGFYGDSEVGSLIATWLKTKRSPFGVTDLEPNSPVRHKIGLLGEVLLALFIAICVIAYGLPY